mgnify:CR=1
MLHEANLDQSFNLFVSSHLICQDETNLLSHLVIRNPYGDYLNRGLQYSS